MEKEQIEGGWIMENNNKRVIVSGGNGFLGHHVIEHIMKNTNWDIVVLDRMNYASMGFDRIKEIEAFNHKKVKLLTIDLAKRFSEGVIREIGEVDYIFHLAASTHVQRSIENPEPFIYDNVLGTFYLLEFARKLKKLKKFILMSTDEVYGDAPKGIKYKEDDRINPKNPYSATKLCSEALVNAYHHTYNLPSITVNCMNIFGERQHPEKYVPLCIKKILSGEKLTVHTDSTKTQHGSRFWIHARNVASALMFLIEKGEDGEKYHIEPPDELNNLEIAQLIAKIIGKELKYELVDWHSTRPGHDVRYALDGSKLRELGWKIPVPFEESFKKTIKWSIDPKNKHWLGD